jgi:hypothetical protein
MPRFTSRMRHPYLKRRILHVKCLIFGADEAFPISNALFFIKDEAFYTSNASFEM